MSQNAKQVTPRKAMKPVCKCRDGVSMWSGSPARNNTGWTCDDCGRFIPAKVPA